MFSAAHFMTDNSYHKIPIGIIINFGFLLRGKEKRWIEEISLYLQSNPFILFPLLNGWWSNKEKRYQIIIIRQGLIALLNFYFYFCFVSYNFIK